ncbi:carbamoyltransferase HypF [Nitrogeniibacter aestuarii]|uniref:carbamoyltransferase HypF n=1 Tax=Nitrogeniibacter aestuarii TaxID=2815343 RepID=UPI001D108399|nr:carbamoyltransferase HypF [Nitrogeniibacter aestuarii]
MDARTDRTVPLLERRRVRVRGIVQGVGFRPFVYRLAQELDLAGWVRNDAEGVEMEVQGLPGNISALLVRMVKEAPRLARVDHVEANGRAPDPDDRGFTIRPSHGGAVTTAIGADTSVCPDCLAELFDQEDRRWRYPFINCTHCGPRYTITRALPYDRANTSMAGFTQCEACQDEYEAPTHRRFHAEPNACPACGPSLSYYRIDGVRVATRDPIAEALLAILSGQIVAIKGLGGYNLVCDARNPEAVEHLRMRKQRGDKPFAVMVLNANSARQFARVGLLEDELVSGPERPIVLMNKRRDAEMHLWGVAPDLGQIGFMLPNTPLHYMLFHDEAGRPAGTQWLDEVHPLALVVTSANPGGEPLVIDNVAAFDQLKGIADFVLTHDRDILVRADDSVMRVIDHAPTTIRRGRGYTPQAIRLSRKGPAVLATGGYLKNTICLTRGDEAFLSQHVGDLSNAATCEAMDAAIAHLSSVLECQPEWIACDLHPDFHATRVAHALAAERNLPLVEVQHHHAHIGAVLAEHRFDGPVLGLALDGVGMGADGDAWGGELLKVDGARFERLGHLRPLRLPGGDRAAREPWRMAASVMFDIGHGDLIADRFGAHRGADRLAEVLEKDMRCPPTSSMGRWFDAAAGLLGVCDVMQYEGEAAMRLEALAADYGPVLPLHQGWYIDRDRQLDLRPLIASLMDERHPARGAAVFHTTLIAALADWVVDTARAEGLDTVALGGGCFLNALITEGLSRRLGSRGLTVLRAHQAPTSDGGLSLGQAWVAIARAME